MSVFNLDSKVAMESNLFNVAGNLFRRQRHFMAISQVNSERDVKSFELNLFSTTRHHKRHQNKVKVKGLGRDSS